jgi:hypothetical protein
MARLIAAWAIMVTWAKYTGHKERAREAETYKNSADYTPPATVVVTQAKGSTELVAIEQHSNRSDATPASTTPDTPETHRVHA